MNQDQLRALLPDIWEVPNSTIEVPRAKVPLHETRAMVIFTGGLIGFEDSINSLRAIREAGIGLDVAQSESAKKILDQEKIASLNMTELNKSLVGDHPFLIMPILTVNTLAKTALGICDSLASNVMSEFFLRNRPVLVAIDAACPDSPGKREWFPNIQPNYASLLRDYLAKLISFGVIFTTAKNLAPKAVQLWNELITTSRQPAKTLTGLITAQIINDLPSHSIFKLARDAIVTPSARDHANARNIKFEL